MRVGCGLQQAVESFHKKGFAVVPAAIRTDIIQQAVAAIEMIQSRVGSLPQPLVSALVMERELPAAKRDGVPPEATGDAIFIIGDLPRFDHRFVELLVEPPIVELTEHLLRTRKVEYHFSNVTMKHPKIGSEVSWHRDFPNEYICPKHASMLRIMICLDGMELDGGATRFGVGSHEVEDQGLSMPRHANRMRELEERVETAVCPPGSLVLIHPMVIHGGPPNKSGRMRRNVVVQWGRADDRPIQGAAESLTGFSPGAIRRWLKSHKQRCFGTKRIEGRCPAKAAPGYEPPSRTVLGLGAS